MTEYLNITPRFQSEYGLQSFPVMRDHPRVRRSGDMQPESPVMRAHQKYDSGNGNQRLLLYIRAGVRRAEGLRLVSSISAR
jgi:beta-mannosidase